MTAIHTDSHRSALHRLSAGLPTIPTADLGLDRHGSVVLVKRNKAVIEERQPAKCVYKVVAGALRTVRLLPDGRRHVGSFLLPGDVFGFTPTDEYTQSVEVVADATLVRYPRERVDSLLRTNGLASRHFINLLCTQLTATQEDLLLLGCKNAVERLASFLLMLADRNSGAEDKAQAVELPMKRGDIADYLGMTVETVSRVLSQLRRRRIIDLPTANHVVFLKRNALEKLCAEPL
jgi:CRP-like cAMP-binding protein